MNAEGIREAQYFVLDTSILDTRGAQSAPIPAHEVRASERDSSGTTVAANGGEGDGADSPTRAAKGGEVARPKHQRKKRAKC